MTKIINLFGGPGVGKSTIASGIFYELKKRGVSCELVTEYAKELAWDSYNNKDLLASTSQVIILGEQFRRQQRLVDKVDYIITDSPILLGAVNFHNQLKKLISVPAIQYAMATERFIIQTFLQFHNINFIIERDSDLAYSNEGRMQNIDDAKHIDTMIQRTLDHHDIGYYPVAQITAISQITNILY